jgi:hypothetical protein
MMRSGISGTSPRGTKSIAWATFEAESEDAKPFDRVGRQRDEPWENA